MPPKRVAILTAGGLAPCLASCVASLIECYAELLPETEIYCYLNGFRSLPIRDRIRITPEMTKEIHKLHYIGGSPIGNSRFSLDDKEECYRKKIVPEGMDPWEVACDKLIEDGIDVIHPIGGDGTSAGAAKLARIAKERNKNNNLIVIGLPKTIDNDIFPISQSLGANTAAMEGAKFFSNIVGGNSAYPRFLLVHELMGRSCGYLAAQTAKFYMESADKMELLTGKDYRREIHALYIPEMEIDFDSESARLKKIMDEIGCVNIFVSEGACLDLIISEMEKDGKEVKKDDSGNLKLSNLKVGEWIAKKLGEKLGSEHSLIQKSGYFCRAAPANKFDRVLVEKCCRAAVMSAIDGRCGIVGQNSENNDEIELIALDKIRGHREFDTSQQWFISILEKTGQFKCATTNNSSSLRKKVFFTQKENVNEFCNEINFASLNTTILEPSTSEAVIVRELFEEFNLAERHRENMSKVLLNLMTTFKCISKQLVRAGLSGGKNDKFNYKTIGLVASKYILESLSQINSVKRVTIMPQDESSINTEKNTIEKYSVFCDSLDGASDIMASVSVGSIFSVYECKNAANLQPGKNILISGYCLFSTTVSLVISFARSVHILKLNPENNEFSIQEKSLRIPSQGNSFSTNCSYSLNWEEGVKLFVDNCKQKKRLFRYIGSMSADLHRVLLKGGIFLYPRNKKYPNGKINLMCEANPFAFLVENAGGKSSNGERSLTTIEPVDVKQTFPIFIGSENLVRELEECFVKS